jgi:hypothetical protein
MVGDSTGRLVLTDEPYNVPIAGHVTGGKHREFTMASGEMTDAEFLALNEARMKAVLPCLRDGGVFGILAWLRCATRPSGPSDGQTDGNAEDALLDLTDRGDIVIDPLLGSGPRS